jgi:Holliday junction resolvase RusA-like endonuclease
MKVDFEEGYDEDGSRYVEFTILGEPASKANSRRIVPAGNGRVRSIKSDKALKYLTAFERQCPVLEEKLEGELRLYLFIHYASRRPDLDGSLIEDALQGKIYANDRAITEKHYAKSIDPGNPRTVIRCETIPGSARGAVSGSSRGRR